MGKISKLFKGEIKKIFLGLGMFFMAGFLILTLTISPKLFNPTTKNDISTNVSINSSTVEDVYSSFLTYKTDYEKKLVELESDIESLIEIQADFKKNLVDISSEIYDHRLELNSLVYNGNNQQKLDCLINLITNAEEYNTLYSEYLNYNTTPLILVTKQLDLEINLELETLLKLLNKDGDKTTDNFYIELNDALENCKCVANLKHLSSEIKGLEYSSEILKSTLETYKTKKDSYKLELLSKINDNANKASIDKNYNDSQVNVKETKSLAFKYLSCDSTCYNILKESLMLNISTNFSDAEMASFLKFENFNSYSHNENLNKNIYLYNNNYTDADFSAMFAFNTNSGSQKNAFDYMYFTMEIASVLIIIFTVIIGAGMIAKEYSDGTIKLLAIRPFSRNKIVLAKILATMFLSFLLVLTVLVVSLITGYILYGISFPTMLIVLNGSITFTLPIWVVFLIYIACLLIKIWIFALLSIAISVLFKSYVLSVCISAGIYILNLIVTFVSKGASWLKYNIFANLDLFKYFGGSFTTNYSTTQNLNSLFISPVFADTSIWLTVATISIMAIVLNIILFTVFKHRDIT